MSTRRRDISPELATARGRVAGLSRDRDPDDPVFIEAKRDLAAANIDQFVKRALAAAPPLTSEQADRIAARLRGEVR
ncbi:hypothetical protein AB3K78_11765 [Leucobacter sp. HNU]|uniref:hypothetical protein n=1 Tax=Leucobacter sp. HNU TaxID=3236805 RepID=UPI003A806BD3